MQSVTAQPEYAGRGPCPSNNTMMGYTSTDLLNDDIITDMTYYIFEDNDPPDFFHYVLCPETTFKIASSVDPEDSDGESPIIPGLANSFFTCGEDGKSDNNCTITGGDFHFYFPDFIIAKEVYLMGLTFTEAKIASIFGDAHPASHVIFLDSHWKNNTGSAATFIHYTPEEQRRNRKLVANQPYTMEDVNKAKLEDAKYLSALNHRDLQPSIKFSMSCVFVDCSFTGNKNELATIFNFGGAAELIDTTFVENEADELAIFTNIGNAHAFIHENSSFLENSARLGPVYIDKDSFLQLSEDNMGSGNTGGQCDGIFLEDKLSSCFDSQAQCSGDCCEFGDESCDLSTEGEQMEPPEKESEPISEPEFEIDIDTSTSQGTEKTEESTTKESLPENDPIEDVSVQSIDSSQSSHGTLEKHTFLYILISTILVLSI